MNDPVFEQDGEWFFWDEVWANAFGPYASEEAARAACQQYAEAL